jgi:hypothetical protein
MTLKLDDWITQLIDLFVAADIFGPSCAHITSAQYCDLIYIYTIPILSLLKFEACQKGSAAWGGLPEVESQTESTSRPMDEHGRTTASIRSGRNSIFIIITSEYIVPL